MRNFFSMDSGFFRVLNRVADLLILNILFLLCCLPIFTIGAAATALYYVTLKMAENEEGYIAKSFWKSFKQNFKQATVIWLILLAIGALLVFDLFFLKDAVGTMVNVFRIVIIASLVLYCIVLLYVFPTLARFYNSIKNTFRNAFLMAIADLPRTFLILVISIGSVLLTFWNNYTVVYGLMIWVLLGFAVVAFANSFFFSKTFAKYSPKEEEEIPEDPDHWSVDDTQTEETSESNDTSL